MTPHLCTFAIAKPHGISVGQRNPLLPYSVRGLKLGTNWQNHTSTDSLLIFLLTSCSHHKLKMIIHICFLSLRAWRWRYGFLLWGPNSTVSLHPLGVAWWLRWSLQLKQNFYSSTNSNSNCCCYYSSATCNRLSLWMVLLQKWWFLPIDHIFVSQGVAVLHQRIFVYPPLSLNYR